MSASPPMVQVVVLAYNHAAYIQQALDSVLAQQTDFPFEIIIGEDCSTDGTRQLIAGYQARYPALIRPIYQPRNAGMGANLRACLAACQAPYIATLEGDDYWLDPHKLQKQVAWLEANPTYSMCFHRVEFLDARASPPTSVVTNTGPQEVFTFADFLRRTVASTGSVLLRNRCSLLPAWLFDAIPIDYPLLLLQVAHGPAKLLPEVMSVYRVHGGGIWSGTAYQQNARRFLDMYARLQQHYAATPHSRPLARHLSKIHLNIADDLTARQLPREAGSFIRQALRNTNSLSPANLKSLVGVLSRWLPARIRQGHYTDT